MHDDFSALGTEHWLGWLGEDPAKALRDTVEGMLEAQVAGAHLVWMQLTGAPHYLTGVKRTEDGKKIQVTRAGLAAPFRLAVHDPSGDVDELVGIATWVATGLDGNERRDRTFLDLNKDMDWGKTQLEARIFEIDRSTVNDH